MLAKEGSYFDTAISQFVYSFRTPVLTDVMHVISFLGSEFAIATTIAITIFLFSRHHKREATLFFTSVVIGYVLNFTIKFILKVPRPTLDPIYIAQYYSFPSGHAMNSFIFYASVSYLVYHFTRKKWPTIVAFGVSGILVSLVGLSRIYLGVHYPSDVIAGFIAGFWWFVTVILLDKTLHFYHISRAKKDKKL